MNDDTKSETPEDRLRRLVKEQVALETQELRDRVANMEQEMRLADEQAKLEQEAKDAELLKQEMDFLKYPLEELGRNLLDAREWGKLHSLEYRVWLLEHPGYAKQPNANMQVNLRFSVPREVAAQGDGAIEAYIQSNGVKPEVEFRDDEGNDVYGDEAKVAT